MSAMLWERRRSYRIPISGKALLQTADQREHHFEGLYDLEDLSIGGCLISGTRTFDVRSHIDVAIQMNGEAEIELPAKIVRASERGLRAHMALRFMERSAAVEDRIQDLTLRAIEDKPHEDILLVHAHPERVTPLLDAMRVVGQRIVAARTARDAVSVLETTTEQIRVALVAPVVGTSSAYDIMKLILRRFPHVDCVLLSRAGAERLGRAIRTAGRAPEGAWSLSRLRKVIASQDVLTVSSA